MRRQVLTALCCVASLGALSGCFSYDAAKPEVLYQNNLDETVTVNLEGAAVVLEQMVRNGTGKGVLRVRIDIHFDNAILNGFVDFFGC